MHIPLQKIPGASEGIVSIHYIVHLSTSLNLIGRYS